jgi:hypothetical protein
MLYPAKKYTKSQLKIYAANPGGINTETGMKSRATSPRSRRVSPHHFSLR